MSEPTCDTCRWSRERGDEYTCHLNPKVYSGMAYHHPVFDYTPVDAYDFCSHHEPKPDNKEMEG